LVETATTKDELTELRLTHSTASAIRCPTGYHYLALGYDTYGAQRLALTSSLASVLRIPRESTILCEPSGIQEADYLALVGAELTAVAIVDSLFAGQKLAVHNAPESIARAILAHVVTKGVKVTLTVDSQGMPVSPAVASQIQIPMFPARADIEAVLPSDLVCFVDFSASNQAENVAMMTSYLPSYCRKESLSTIFSTHGVDTSAPKDVVGQLLARTVSMVKGRGVSASSTPLSLDTLAQGGQYADALTIIGWVGSCTAVPARVTRFESNQLFKSDKTYWLVGLSGALGISLCDWMIERGVRYLVLTSRNPKIDPRWIENHERNGVVIKILLWYILYFPIRTISY
jgi:hypothetical protein